MMSLFHFHVMLQNTLQLYLMATLLALTFVRGIYGPGSCRRWINSAYVCIIMYELE